MCGVARNKFFVEIARAPDQSVTKLVTDNGQSLSFELEYVGTGPLPLKFKDYRT